MSGTKRAPRGRWCVRCVLGVPMAKRKRTAKRPAKGGKRRPTKRVAPKRRGGVFQPGVFQPGVFQGLPPSASQQKLSPAVQSTIGGAEPPFPLRAAIRTIEPPPPQGGEAHLQGVGSLTVDAVVIPESVNVVIIDRLSKQPVNIRDTARRCSCIKARGRALKKP
jgi:hypothetical protein